LSKKKKYFIVALMVEKILFSIIISLISSVSNYTSAIIMVYVAIMATVFAIAYPKENEIINNPSKLK
jgi:hypothetical protein